MCFLSLEFTELAPMVRIIDSMHASNANSALGCVRGVPSDFMQHQCRMHQLYYNLKISARVLLEAVQDPRPEVVVPHHGRISDDVETFLPM